MLLSIAPMRNIEQPRAAKEFSLQLAICLLYRLSALDKAARNAPDAVKPNDPRSAAHFGLMYGI
jgi:hypothetical protein